MALKLFAKMDLCKVYELEVKPSLILFDCLNLLLLRKNWLNDSQLHFSSSFDLQSFN